MAVRYALAAVGGILILFGAFGMYTAEEIVERQREEHLSPVAAEASDERLRIRVTRAMAALFAVVGIGLVAFGIGAL